jgi:superfamily II DNA/RNA helicase
MCAGPGVPPSDPKCPDGYLRRGGRTGGFQLGKVYDIGTCEEDPAVKAAKEAEEAAAKAAADAAKLQADTAAAAERAQKDVDKYTMSFNAVQTQKNQIQKTGEVMAAAAGKYTGVSKDLQYSVDQFDTQLKDLQNQINITNRRTPAPSWWPWLDIFLNVMIVLVLLYAIYSLVRRTYYVKPVVTQLQYQ